MITINQKIGDRWHQSSLAFNPPRIPAGSPPGRYVGTITAIGVIPHGNEWLPATAEDRDALVEFLLSIKYPTYSVNAGD